ncbi:FCD domain-containing protein [Sulfobacillus harzensis]|uniref:GntR family transcriptional regulator n=1 Tax=Sulfobacillus harzensis TaxID=2729629 RepID=A0A7Y0L6A6_9FIRM|nr:GntR family transcriptional regulator [Sulfobacillus harzensis]
MDSVAVRTVRDQVADSLRRAIFRGELLPGQSVGQEDIAQRLGVSRMPVREAFHILEHDGLLVLQNHRRAVVREWTPEDIADHYTIRGLLEGEAAARAAQDPSAHQSIRIAHEEAQQLVHHDDAKGFVQANEVLHREIWEAGGSRHLIELLNQLWHGLPPHLPELIPGQMGRSNTEHNQIVEAITAGLGELARKRMQEHILRSRNDFLERSGGGGFPFGARGVK